MTTVRYSQCPTLVSNIIGIIIIIIFSTEAESLIIMPKCDYPTCGRSISTEWMISQLEDGHFPETCKDHHLEGQKGRHNAWLQELNNTFETHGGHQRIEFGVMPSMHSQFTVRKVFD
jgi:hypothetical protein